MKLALRSRLSQPGLLDLPGGTLTLLLEHGHTIWQPHGSEDVLPDLLQHASWLTSVQTRCPVLQEIVPGVVNICIDGSMRDYVTPALAAFMRATKVVT